MASSSVSRPRRASVAGRDHAAGLGHDPLGHLTHLADDRHSSAGTAESGCRIRATLATCRARSPIRSRSALIRRPVTITRRSVATGGCRARTRARLSNSAWSASTCSSAEITDSASREIAVEQGDGRSSDRRPDQAGHLDTRWLDNRVSSSWKCSRMLLRLDAGLVGRLRLRGHRSDAAPCRPGCERSPTLGELRAEATGHPMNGMRNHARRGARNLRRGRGLIALAEQREPIVDRRAGRWAPAHRRPRDWRSVSRPPSGLRLAAAPVPDLPAGRPTSWRCCARRHRARRRRGDQHAAAAYAFGLVRGHGCAPS